MDHLNNFISGATMMGSFVAGLFFIRFWRRSRDRLFLIFGIAFFVMGLNRIPLVLTAHNEEFRLSFYTVRLCAFLLILAAIIDKNHRKH